MTLIAVKPPEDEESWPPPRPGEPSTILFELIPGEWYQDRLNGLEFNEIQCEGGSAEYEAEQGMLDWAIADGVGDVCKKRGWYVVENFISSYSTDYWGEADADFEWDRIRPATVADMKRFGFGRRELLQTWWLRTSEAVLNFLAAVPFR